MSVVRTFYSRFEHVVHELSKFGAVGAIALAVNMTVLGAMLASTHNKQIYATLVSTIVATIVAYIGNRYWTYKDRDKLDRRREMLLFFVINGVAMVIEVAAVFIAKYGFHQSSSPAVFIAKYGFGLPLGMLFRLYTYRTFVFPQNPDVTDGGVGGRPGGGEPEYVPVAAHTPLFPHTHAGGQHNGQHGQAVAETVSR